MTSADVLMAKPSKSNALLRKIEDEIEVLRKKDPFFLPDQYRKHRLAGVPAEEIDYDMCHVWR